MSQDNAEKSRIENAQGGLLTTLDLARSFVFAVEGAMMAIEGELDLLGVIVLAFATALGGGMIRDLLIGAIPPQALRDWRYPVVAFTGGTVAVFGHQLIREIPRPVIIDLDAVGLTLFAIAGTEKALLYQIRPFIALFMGAITGAGDGTVRDVLLMDVPAVLRVDVYTTAALAGLAAMLTGRRLGLPAVPSTVIGGGVCFGLRMVSVWPHWNLPRATEFQW